MLDQYGREIDYIRISVTDCCNLRCMYCMPEECVAQIPHEEILTYEEIIRLCCLMVPLGIRRIKLTGGEPLVRKGIEYLIARLKAVPGVEMVTLTTNGVLLKKQMKLLYAAGIDGINISLDTLEEDMFRQISRCGCLSDVLDGIREVLNYPSVHLKINCVSLAGVNESQWVRLAGIAKDNPIDVRFIEMMPIGRGRDYEGKTEDVICRELERAYGLSKAALKENISGSGPSTYRSFPGFKGHIGFISAMTHQFCSECNRVRLTSEGFLKLCLQYKNGTDLKTPMREGISDEKLAELIRRTIYNKPRQHHFLDGCQGEDLEQRQMSGIGG